MMFQKVDQTVHQPGADGQNDHSHHHQIQPEYLTAINNQITDTGPGNQKFPDNDANQTKPHIDLGQAQHIIPIGRQNQFV